MMLGDKIGWIQGRWIKRKGRGALASMRDELQRRTKASAQCAGRVRAAVTCRYMRYGPTAPTDSSSLLELLGTYEPHNRCMWRWASV